MLLRNPTGFNEFLLGAPSGIFAPFLLEFSKVPLENERQDGRKRFLCGPYQVISIIPSTSLLLKETR
jgi:hypothetical protein